MAEQGAEPALEPPASTGRIVGVGLGLSILVLVVYFLMKSPLEPLDPFEELGSHFAVGGLPFEFRPTEAFGLSSGEVIVRLERDDEREAAADAIETAAEELLTEADHAATDDSGEADGGRGDEGDEGDDASDDGSADLDSVIDGGEGGESGEPGEPGEDGENGEDDKKTLADTAEERERNAQADGTPPSLVFLVRYPRERSLEVRNAQLKRKVEEEGVELSGDTLELTVDGGRMRWHDYEVDFVQEREYEVGGHFTDVIRVNLSLGTECWFLFAHWPRDYRASRAPVEALLEALPPVAAD